MLQNPLQNKHDRKTALLIAAVFFILVSFAYNGYAFWQMRAENLVLKNDLKDLENLTNLVQTNLNKTRVEKTAVLDALQNEKAINLSFQDQIQGIVGTVGVLEKLSKTDTELLKKYSKVYFLNENYIPPKLLTVDEKFVYEKGKLIQVHESVYPYLIALLNNAEANNIPISILSGYRSFGAQASLKSAYTVTYGAGTANKFSADQGYSEHQLGTTVDFTTPKIGAGLTGFSQTDTYKWLVENAYKYGFVMSYPKENKYYIYEPWHWRFVGVALATKLHNDGNYFYAMDQRDINQYLVNIFD